MRKEALLAAVLATFVSATPVLAQDEEARAGNEFNTTTGGLLATTPSRIRVSSREMNRGREQVWAVRMTPMQTRTYAERALRSGGFRCRIEDVAQVAQLASGPPIVEVACAGGGGLIIADTNPLQATDCLDLSPTEGIATSEGGRLSACTLPANAAFIASMRE